MNRLDNTNDLLKYMSSVFDTELNIYIQNQLLAKMNSTYLRLGNKKQLCKPKLKKADVSTSDCFVTAGTVCGIITAIIAFFIYKSRHHGFFSILNSLWTGLVFAVIGFFVFGSVCGIPISCIRRAKQQKLLNEKFEAETLKYKKAVEQEENRVARENAQKSRLSNEISLLSARLRGSGNNLRQMYDYDIIKPEYRNIYAVSSICGYLKNGRTHSLEFNEKTGDRGAYNIYEEERRLDKIITNTEEIINKLDQVIKNQYVLAEGLNRAREQIDMLSREVNSFAINTQQQLRNMENSQALIAYNQERMTAEAGILSWLAIMR